MKAPILAAVFVLPSLVACANGLSVSEQLAGFRDQPIARALRRLGPPDAIASVDGLTHYRWQFSRILKRQRLNAIPTTGMDGAGATPGATLYQSESRVRQNCVIELVVDRSERIVQGCTKTPTPAASTGCPVPPTHHRSWALWVVPALLVYNGGRTPQEDDAWISKPARRPQPKLPFR